MAHEVETMAYAGQVPWHGLGKQVDNNMSPDEMLKAAQIDWTVSKRPAYTIDKPNCWNIVDPTGEAGFFLFVTATTKYFHLAVRVTFLSKTPKLWTFSKSLPKQVP